MPLRIFLPPELIQHRTGIRLPDDKAHYLRSVMRCRVGDPVIIIDGEKTAYLAMITTVGGGKKEIGGESSRARCSAIMIDIMQELAETPSHGHTVLCQAVLKGEKMDLVVQKATELGVKEIIPLITDRGIVRETARVQRWRKIAEEAAEQCERSSIPPIGEPLALDKFLKEPGNRGGLFLWEQGGLAVGETLRLLQERSLSTVQIIVGPEGGFSAEEAAAAVEAGFVKTTLGRRMLRAETAAIAAIAIVEFALDRESSDEPPVAAA